MEYLYTNNDMGIYRTYFDKNTTIVSNSDLNTARNPIGQLYYGPNTMGVGTYSRFLLYFDTTEIANRVADKRMMGTLTHTLKMKNTSFFDGELIAADFDAKKRAYSFDLILFRIPEYWDEGAGYDFLPQIFESPNNNAYINGPANWEYRTTTELWSAPGIVDYSGTNPTIIATYHFQFGNEDVEMDISTEVNNIITSAVTNNGYCLCFRHDYEIFTGVTQQQYVGFYSRHTNTYYEPFLETTWNDTIQDDRNYFFMGQSNRIFYYAYVNGQLINLDSLPTVQILDENNLTFTSGTASQLSKGVYYFDVTVPEDSTLDRYQYSDTWNVTYGGRSKVVNGKITLLYSDNFLPSPGICNTF